MRVEFITAKAARNITNNVNKYSDTKDREELRNIMKQIYEKCNAGENELSIHDWISEYSKNELANLGYTINSGGWSNELWTDISW